MPAIQWPGNCRRPGFCASQVFFALPEKRLRCGNAPQQPEIRRHSGGLLQRRPGPDFQCSPCYHYKNLRRHGGHCLPSLCDPPRVALQRARSWNARMEGSLYHREDRFDPFTVVLFKALQVLAFLFFIALLAMKPAADSGKVVKRAEFIITMTWPDRHPDDVDLYVQDPAGKLVWYNQRDVGLMVLERDDRGDTNDFAVVDSKKIPLPIREELVSIRGVMAGEYTVNIHLYHHIATAPVPVSVKVEKLNPVVQVIDYKTLFLDHTDEEKTVVRFTLAEDGSVVRLSDAEKSLIDTIAWKKTFRNLRR